MAYCPKYLHLCFISLKFFTILLSIQFTFPTIIATNASRFVTIKTYIKRSMIFQKRLGYLIFQIRWLLLIWYGSFLPCELHTYLFLYFFFLVAFPFLCYFLLQLEIIQLSICTIFVCSSCILLFSKLFSNLNSMFQLFSKLSRSSSFLSLLT